MRKWKQGTSLLSPVNVECVLLFCRAGTLLVHCLARTLSRAYGHEPKCLVCVPMPVACCVVSQRRVNPTEVSKGSITTCSVKLV